MTIQIFGTGCAKCNMLEQSAKDAVKELGLDIKVEKIDNPDDIVEKGILITPAIAINGDVKSAGKSLPKEKIIELIKGEK